jgi:hypothetical protein
MDRFSASAPAPALTTAADLGIGTASQFGVENDLVRADRRPAFP